MGNSYRAFTVFLQQTQNMENFRISGLEIENIGPFGHLKLDFPEKPAGSSDRAEIHILTGENGTGKTTLLEMMSACILSSTNTLYYKCRNEQSRAKLLLGSEGHYARWMVVGNSFTREYSSIRLDNFIKGIQEFPTGRFNVAYFAYSGYRRIEQAEVKENPDIQGNPFEYVLDFKQSIDPKKIINWIASTKINEALALSQSDVSESQNFRASIARIEGTIGEIIGKPIQLKLEYKPRKVVVEVAGETLDFNLLPDGLKSIVSWIADLLMRMDRVKWENDTPVFERNFILFLDEIEVHLHPAWQRKILPAVQKLFPNAQIFISTHSPFVVGSVDGAWIHKFVKPNGDSLLAGPPILSEDAKSFRYWLDEVFDIKKEFGDGAQRQLDRFYELRNLLLVNGTPQERAEFVRIATDLVGQSREMESIISLELRQLNKRIQVPLEI